MYHNLQTNKHLYILPEEEDGKYTETEHFHMTLFPVLIQEHQKVKFEELIHYPNINMKCHYPQEHNIKGHSPRKYDQSNRFIY